MSIYPLQYHPPCCTQIWIMSFSRPGFFSHPFLDVSNAFYCTWALNRNPASLLDEWSGHKMAERCARWLLLDRDWMKIGMSGVKRQGLSVRWHDKIQKGIKLVAQDEDTPWETRPKPTLLSIELIPWRSILRKKTATWCQNEWRTKVGKSLEAGRPASNANLSPWKSTD